MSISIEYMEVTKNREFDDNAKGLVGIELDIYLYSSNPDDEGQLEVKWGNYETEIFSIAPWALMLGHNEIGNSLPPGTHTICTRMI